VIWDKSLIVVNIFKAKPNFCRKNQPSLKKNLRFSFEWFTKLFSFNEIVDQLLYLMKLKIELFNRIIEFRHSPCS